MNYDFTCPQCSTMLNVKDWREHAVTGTREPWCFCSRCKYKCYAKKRVNKDELLGKMTWKYIDRMSDPTPQDSAEEILREFVDEWHEIQFGGRL